MNAAIYLRVSSTICLCGHEVKAHLDGGKGACKHLGGKCDCERCRPRQNETNQEAECLKVCVARGWDPVVFREQESAVKHRPEWEKVKDAVHRGEVVAVVVWALDRIGRDRVAVSHELAEIARKCAAVVSVQESWIDQPIGNLRDLLIQQFTWFAETERKRLIERTKAGQARARAQGKRIGRPGLSVEKVKAARDAFECGLSAFRAARKVNIPETTLREYWRRWSGFNAYPGYPRKVSAGGGA